MITEKEHILKRQFIIGLILVILAATQVQAAGRAATDLKYFYGSITETFGTTTAEFLVESIPTDGIELLSIEVTLTATAPVTGNLKFVGSDTKITALTDDWYAVDARSAVQSWTTSGAQTIIQISSLKPCAYLGFTATISSALTTPGSIAIDIRGMKAGEKVGYTKWQ